MWGTRVPPDWYTCRGRERGAELWVNYTGMRTHLTSVAPHATRSAARRMTALAAVTGLALAGLAGLVASPVGASQIGSPDDAFNANVAELPMEELYHLVPLKDGGFVFYDYLENRSDETLRKIDAAGNEVTSFAANVGSIPSTQGLREGPNGEIFTVARTPRKYDSSGHEVLEFASNSGFMGDLAGEVQSMVVTSDGGVVIGGWRKDGQSRFHVVFKKLDSRGVEVTSFETNAKSSFEMKNSDEVADGGPAHMVQLGDGSLLVAGGGNYNVGFEGQLKKFSSAGVEDMTFSANVSDAVQGYYPTALDVLPNGTIIVAVRDYAEEEFFLFTFDSAGNQITTWDEQAVTMENQIPLLQHTAQNHVIFGGYKELRELDSSGDVLEDSFVSDIIPGSIESIDHMYVTPGGDLLVAGEYPTVIKKFFLNEPAPTVSSVAPATGLIAGGTSITITGTNFAAGASLGVTVGGVAATSVRVVSATKITAKTPAHAAGVANIVVTNGDGQTATLSGAFTFTVPADPPPVTVLSGAAAKNAKVVTVASKVSGDFRAAPSINVVVAVGVIPSVKGLPKSSSIKVEVSATFQNRPTTNYQTIGTLRSDANGNLKVTAFKASRAGSLNIRFKTSAGKNYYLKVQVTAR
ncbi:unannotated protein [freshwater metagenome]|uniref:Unannotated protein n=1 Tax=freshwater metagenome TaxID=449393 RepID=A0A6J7ILS1_9ZZZZ|nr:hypothetical protein [Actinomycetota bacterium]